MPNYNNFRILVDCPTENPALGFLNTAKGLASIIKLSEPQFAIGIFGSWGSGKTTLMSAIKKELRDDQIVTVDFSAWRYEKEEHLIIPLLDTIRESLVVWSEKILVSKPNATESIKKTRKNLSAAAIDTAKTLGKVMASLTAGISFKLGLPNALEFSYDASKALSMAKNFDTSKVQKKTKNDFALKRSDPHLFQSIYHACFKAIKESFSSFHDITKKTRIVIFIDDLDRCLPPGAVEVLESMKLFFDMKGFIFVVGLDRSVVEHCIDCQYEVKSISKDLGRSSDGSIISGSSYLAKIFQVPFSLAPISLNQIDGLIASLCRDSKLPVPQKKDLQINVRPHLSYLVTGWSLNPREVKRYINAYTLQLKVKKNLDPNAVLALQTVSFRHDWDKLLEAINAYGIDFTTALRSFFDGDKNIIEEFEMNEGDISEEIRSYLGPGGVGNTLITVNNLDEYLYSGEATRSSFGGIYIDLLRIYRDLRKLFNELFLTERKDELEKQWSNIESQLSKFHSIIRTNIESRITDSIKIAINDFMEWVNDMGSNALALILKSQDVKNLEERKRLKDKARNETDSHLNRLLTALRQLRRQISLIVP